MNNKKRKYLTELEKFRIATEYRYNDSPNWTIQGLDKFTIKQLKKLQQKYGIMIDVDIFLELWKRVQKLQNNNKK